jgi:hypothetical protein
VTLADPVGVRPRDQAHGDRTLEEHALERLELPDRLCGDDEIEGPDGAREAAFVTAIVFHVKQNLEG